MVELPVVATVAQLVSTAISNAKIARDIAKDSSDHALKGAISDLYDVLLEVKNRALELDEENRSLKADIARKDEIVGPIEPHGYFFKRDDLNKPLCPKCYQSRPQNIVYLSGLTGINGGQRRVCVVCNYWHMESPMRPPQISMRGRPSSWSGR